MELNLVIESPEPAEKIVTFVACCHQACMALQTAAAATPVMTTLYLNGTEIGDVGGAGPFQENVAA